jgi:hypothetical protein
MYSEYKIFWKMPSKRNRVLESNSEKKREKETNSALTTES